MAPIPTQPAVPACDVTVQVLQHRALERWAARLLALSGALGLPFTRLDVDSVLREARRKTRLDDWGSDRFVAPMQQVFDSVGRCDYSPIAPLFFRGLAVRAVVHRLQIEAFFERHPEAEAIPIERPIFVLGFPRSGTTVLQNLLAMGERRRPLQLWELANPAPLDPDPDRDRARRLARVESDLAWANRMSPEMASVHDIRPTTAEECWPLMSNALTVLNFDICHALRPYGDWLLAQDITWAYREYRRQLQMLLHRRSAHRLVLKCPEHLWFLDALLAVFPDACVVWTHRDPLVCTASYSSMVSLSRRFLQGHIDPPVIGEHVADRFVTGVERAMAVRDRLGDDRVLDVDYRELVGDPVAATNRVERHFGLRVTDPRHLQAWLDEDRDDRPGSHRYDPAMWGLQREALDERFGAYIERFGL
jgi:hypothetical protein